MKTITHKLRDYFRVKHQCPKELHWLGIGLQFWALGIALCTFSNGFFISRIFLRGGRWGRSLYYHYPQFWYVVLGCLVLPVLAILLKRRSRAAWVILVAAMSGLLTACLVMLIPEIRARARIDYGPLILNAWVSINAIAILLRNRKELLLKWEETPVWATGQRRKKWSNLVKTYLTTFKMVPSMDLSNWKKELADAGFLLLRGIVIFAVLVIAIFMLNDLTGGPLKGVGQIFSMSDAIMKKSVWRQKLILRTFPLSKLREPMCLCSVDYLYEAMEMGNADTSRVFDEAYAELFKYSAPTALDKRRVDGLTYALYLKNNEVADYYYGLMRIC